MVKLMETNITSLKKNWIQFLKNNQIVAYKSDPNTGSLKYNRPVTTADLMGFLESEFETADIKKAIGSVMSSRSGNPDQSSDQNDLQIQNDLDRVDKVPNQQNNQQGGLSGSDTPRRKLSSDPNGVIDVDAREIPDNNRLSNPQRKIPLDPNSAVDVDSREVPDEKPDDQISGKPSEITHKRKPRFKYRHKKGISEAIRERPGPTLSEKDVEAIFSILISSKNKLSPKKSNSLSTNSQSSKDEEFRQLKRMIRDKMSDSQRKALWRALTNG